jgi:predicted GH43/DUF377 family glycosyl hydrolase
VTRIPYFYSMEYLRNSFPFLLLSMMTVAVFCSSCSERSPSSEITSTDSVNNILPSFRFVKVDSVNPVLRPDTSQVFTCPVSGKMLKWEEKDVFNPAAVVRNDTIFLLYRAEDVVGRYAGTSRIGIAWSTDGYHFTKHPVPVLYPDNDEHKKLEWEGGCEDPRVVRDEGGTYYMTYTAYDGDKARMLVASSRDLYNWKKHGHIFANVDSGKYVDIWSKSGSIISRYKDGSPVAEKINGKYWMYGGDVNIWAATSDDLINWSPVMYNQGEGPSIPLRHNSTEIANFKIIFGPREGKFDSDLVEPGPPAIITDSSIVLIYNSRNVKNGGDSSLPEGTYAAGTITLDKNDPTHVLSRSDSYFIRPDKPYEITGQVNHVCFVEGLVHYKGKWFLYYGTADSRIAVAVE